MQRAGSARTHYSAAVTALLVATGLGATACQAEAADPAATDGEPPAVVEPGEDDGPARLSLSTDAVTRIGLETAAVAQSPQFAIPYSAVVYDGQGASWTFTEVAERTYQRTAITISDIVGDQALLSAGPASGTEVVTVGAAELVGVEAGISGGE